MTTTTPPTRVPGQRRGEPSGQAPRTVPSQAEAPATRLAPASGTTLLPSVVIPGVSHAGALRLAGDLGRHPEICLPDVKRIGLFTPLRYGRPVEGHLDDYDRHFAGWSGQRHRLETAPDYFDGGRTMAGALDEAMPGVRVVLLMRDPADRLWTSYADKLARGRLPRAMTFETFVERSLALRANGADRFEANRHFRTLSSGYYVEYLPAWLETFGRRARVVFTEDLHDEPVAQVGALFDWLGLNPALAGTADEPSEAYPSAEAAPGSAGMRLWPVLQRGQGLLRDAGAARRTPRQSERTRARVRSLYAGVNRELAALLRDRGYTALPEWLTQA